MDIKQTICLVLALCLCLAFVPVVSAESSAVTEPGSVMDLHQRMQDIINGKYGVGKYFRNYQSQPCSFAGSSSACHGNHDGSYAVNDGYCNCKVATASIAGTTGGIQCFGYARYVFYQLFGQPVSTSIAGIGSVNVTLVGKTSSATASKVKEIFSNARLGDFIQAVSSATSNHSMIVYEVSDTGVTVLECNYGGQCYINLRTISWSTFAAKYSSFAVYTSTNYPSADCADCRRALEGVGNGVFHSCAFEEGQAPCNPAEAAGIRAFRERISEP